MRQAPRPCPGHRAVSRMAPTAGTRSAPPASAPQTPSSHCTARGTSEVGAARCSPTEPTTNMSASGTSATRAAKPPPVASADRLPQPVRIHARPVVGDPEARAIEDRLDSQTWAISGYDVLAQAPSPRRPDPGSPLSAGLRPGRGGRAHRRCHTGGKTRRCFLGMTPSPSLRTRTGQCSSSYALRPEAIRVARGSPGRRRRVGAGVQRRPSASGAGRASAGGAGGPIRLRAGGRVGAVAAAITGDRLIARAIRWRGE